MAVIAPARPAKTATPPPLVPRFQQSAQNSGIDIDEHVPSRDHDQTHGGTRAGGEWWVKDPPWFLPPPPEWGPMPPTMYTSFFHRPRYPSLSTANYYPLYSKTDEYDAHLPASMSRRATYTQQMIYNNYVNTYRQHTHFTSPAGDPNVGVSTPSLYGNSDQFGGMGEAHARALSSAATHNYFPLFSRTNDYHTSPLNTWATTAAGIASNGGQNPSWGVGFVEQASQLRYHSGQFGDHAVTYFASSPIPKFKPVTRDMDTDMDTDTTDTDTDTGTDTEAGEEDEADDL